MLTRCFIERMATIWKRTKNNFKEMLFILNVEICQNYSISPRFSTSSFDSNILDTLFNRGLVLFLKVPLNITRAYFGLPRIEHFQRTRRDFRKSPRGFVIFRARFRSVWSYAWLTRRNDWRWLIEIYIFRRCFSSGARATSSGLGRSGDRPTANHYPARYACNLCERSVREHIAAESYLPPPSL